MRRLLVPALVFGVALSACTTGSGEAVTVPSGAAPTPDTSPSTTPSGSAAGSGADADATFERDLRRLLSVPPMPAPRRQTPGPWSEAVRSTTRTPP